MKGTINQNSGVFTPLVRGMEIFKGFSWSRNPNRVLIVMALYIAAAVILNSLLF